LILLRSGLSLRVGSPLNWEVFRGPFEGTSIAKFGDELGGFGASLGFETGLN
jgi:hypothetical protein